jgi:hypothetical protein
MGIDGSDWDYINEHMGGHDEDGLPNFISEPGFSDDEYEAKEESSYFETFKDAMAWAKNNLGQVITRAPDGEGFVIKDQCINTPKKIDKNKSTPRRFICKELNDYWYIRKKKCINWFQLNHEIGLLRKEELVALSKEVTELYNRMAVYSNTLRGVRQGNRA